jgi:2-iminobutanoate/2-iminopropanoate deaminase
MYSILSGSSRRLLFALACTALVLPIYAAPPQYFAHPAAAGAPALPFSDAVLSGNTLYLAGHLGLDPKTGTAAADIATEAHLLMEAVRHTLEAAGLTMDDLVSVTVYCTDLKQYEAFNGVYGAYFHGHFPARAFIGASQLVRGAHFELMGVAVRRAP